MGKASFNNSGSKALVQYSDKQEPLILCKCIAVKCE